MHPSYALSNLQAAWTSVEGWAADPVGAVDSTTRETVQEGCTQAAPAPIRGQILGWQNFNILPIVGVCPFIYWSINLLLLLLFAIIIPLHHHQHHYYWWKASLWGYCASCEVIKSNIYVIQWTVWYCYYYLVSNFTVVERGYWAWCMKQATNEEGECDVKKVPWGRGHLKKNK